MNNRQIVRFNKILFLLFSCVYSISVNGQTTVSGKVIEKGSGEPLPFANVIIKGGSVGVTTNVDGFFSLVNVESDSLILVISYVGFNTTELSVEKTTGLIIELEPLGKELDEVVVTAEAYKVFDATAGISTVSLSTKQLSKIPSIGEPDIFRSLQMLPGISSTSESSSGLYIRGGTPDQNLTLLDGITVYKVDHFFGFFSAFNTHAIKDVRLFRGAFPSRYGGRMSGVVELTGKTGSFEKIRGGFNVSLLSVGGYFEMPLGKNLSFFIAGRRSYSEIIKGGLFSKLIGKFTKNESLNASILQNTTTLSTEPDFYFYDLNTKLSYRPTAKDMITLSTYSGKDFLDQSQNTISQISNLVKLNYKLNKLTDWGNRGVSTKWSRQWNPRLYTNILLAGSTYFSNYKRNESVLVSQQDSTILNRKRLSIENNDVLDLSAKANLEWQISLNSKLELGMAYTKNKNNYDNIRDDSLTLLTRSQNAYYAAAYAGQETTLGKLTVNAGFRLTKYELSDELLSEPRLNVLYNVSKKIKLKGAYSKHFQFANQIVNQNISEGSREFWLLADNDLVDIGSATHYVFGASYKQGSWLIDVETYYKQLTGIAEFSIQFKRGVNEMVEELFRKGNGETKGMEVLLQKTAGKYTGWIAYTLSDIRNTFPELNDGLAFRPLFYQRHEFKMVHTVELDDQWNFSANFIYGSGKPFSEPSNRYQIELLDGRTLAYVGIGPRNASYNPPYIRLDVSANCDFKMGKSNARLSLSLFNLLGRRNIWYTEYDFGQSPPLVNQVNYLGFTPNLIFSISM